MGVTPARQLLAKLLANALSVPESCASRHAPFPRNSYDRDTTVTYSSGSSPGTTTLSVANTYSGTTTVSAGTLLLGNASGLGATGGRVAVSGGVLDLGGLLVTRTGSVA